MKVSASLPTGVAALLFDEARKRRRLEDKLVRHLEEAQFQEAILPVVDYLEPYENLLAAASRGQKPDQSELYRFVDRDGELLMLRADFTPMLARLLAPRLASFALPLRLFYRGDVLRYQEERAGRQREFYQLGGEVLGLPGEEGELAALRQFLELLELSGQNRLDLVLGFAGALDTQLLPHPDAAALAAGVVRRERSVARAASPTLLAVVEHGLPDAPSELGPFAAARLERLLAQRDELAAAFPHITLRIDLAEFADQVLDPRLTQQIGARAYYDGLVFRAFAGAAAEPVGGGGRYDRLFERLGAPITASGFSFAIDRLLEPNGRPSTGKNP